MNNNIQVDRYYQSKTNDSIARVRLIAVNLSGCEDVVVYNSNATDFVLPISEFLDQFMLIEDE